MQTNTEWYLFLMLSLADVLRKKKEFFEKIYIDRKVVQEASAEFISVLG